MYVKSGNIYFYSDASGWHLDSQIVPAGYHRLRANNDETEVQIEGVINNQILVSMRPIENFLRENGTPYEDYDTLVAETFSFFVTASSSGGIQGQVEYFADLPDATLHNREFWLVEKGSGIYLINRKPAGLYYSNGTTWNAAPDMIPFFSDANFRVYDDIDDTKQIQFQLENISGANTRTITFPDVDVFLHSPNNVICVAQSGCEYTSIEDALASITDNSSTNRYVINVTPGVYIVDNSLGAIALKDYVTIQSFGERDAVIQPLDPTINIFSGANFAYINGFIFTGITTGYVIDHSYAGIVNFNDCVLRDCGNGFMISNVNSSLELRRTIINNPLSYTTAYGVRVTAGKCTVKDFIIRINGVVTTAIDIGGSDAIASIIDFTSISPNVQTCFNIHDGCLVSVSISNALNCYDGFVIYGDDTTLRMDGVKVFNAQNDGFRIENTGTNIDFSLYSGVMSECGNYNFNILNPNSVTTGTGFTELDNSYVVERAGVYVGLIDNKEGDEGFNILGELHVGRPLNPAESSFGQGDSYTFGMLVYTETSGGVFTDVSTEAKSASGSTFTFPGTAADNAIYLASSIEKDADFLIHHGLKVSIDTAATIGTGEIIFEYWNGSAWTEINAMVSDSDIPFLPYGKDYFSRIGSFQIRYDIVPMNSGDWVKNDPMTLGEDYYWIRMRIVTAVTTAPVFQQFKLHPSRAEINSDGFTEFFGNGRPYVQLPITIGSGKPFEGNMQDQTIYLDENIGVGYSQNRFTAQSDKFGWEIVSPNCIDTSSKLAFRFMGRPSTSETITWTVRWSWISPDGTVYTTEPASGSNPNSSSDTVSKAVVAGTIEWFEIYLDISNLIARRDADYPDLLFVTIQPSTMGGTFDLMGVQAYYLVWSTGGHSD